MVQTSFSAGDTASVTADLLDISTGADAAANTAYTITMTAAVSAATETANLRQGSSLTLVGPFPFIVATFDVSGTLTTDLNVTGTITLDNGVLNNPALTSNTGGTIVAGLYAGPVLGSLGDDGDSVLNNGAIQYGGTAFAAVELDSGTVQNGWNGAASALISGVAVGVQFQDEGLVQNGGTISGSGTASTAVFIQGDGTVDNGQLGDTGATISGANNGVQIDGDGAVINDGTIIGVTSDAVALSEGTVQNGESGDVTALISGGPADNGVLIETGPGAVTNFGTITGGGVAGVFLEAGGGLTNGTSADPGALVEDAADGVLLEAAGAVFNSGTIEADGTSNPGQVIGAFLAAGGIVENLSAAASILGVDWGALVEAGAGAVTNQGTIRASGTAGLGVDLVAGGTVVNGLSAGAAATIAGGLDGVRISTGESGVGAGAGVTNDGTIAGAVGVDFESGPTPAAGTLINAGLIESTAGPAGSAVVFGTGAETLVVEPTGTFVGGVLGDNAAGSSTTLELAPGTSGTLSALAQDGGTVTDSAGGFGFSAIGTIVLDAGASWTVRSPGTLDTVDNAGGLTIIGAVLTETGALTNSGTLGVTGGSLTETGSLTNTGVMSIASGTLSATTGVLTDQGTITLAAGGSLLAGGGGITAAGTPDILIDAAAGSPATLDIDGAAAVASSGGFQVGIGIAGGGSVLIGAGGTLLAGTPFAADEAIVLGGGVGANGALTVTGTGSRLTAKGQIGVGLSGTGSLLIGSQATAVAGGDTIDPSAGIDIGQRTGGSGIVTVQGLASLLSNTGRFIVGDAGAGELSIQAGGTVITSPGTVSGLAAAVIASQAGAVGSSVDVAGTGSDWRVGGSLVVGQAADGSVNVAAGGAVSVGGPAVIAAQSGASGSSLTLSGAGSNLTVTGLLSAGAAGSGSLSLANGATATAGSLDAGVSASAVGQISVIGSGTGLSITGNATVADAGTGVLSILNGASFSATSLTIGDQSGSSGALIVSGAGSVINLSGALNIGTALGVGDLTVGPGAAVHAAVVNLNGQVVLEGGLLDPSVQVISQGQTAGGFGTILADDIIVEGVIQAGGARPDEGLLLVEGTVLGGGKWSENGKAQRSESAAQFAINQGGTLELTGAVLNAATTTFSDDLQNTYTVTKSVVDISFDGNGPGVLTLDDVAGFAGTVASVFQGDDIVVTGGTLSGLGVTNGNTVTVADSGAGARQGGVDTIVFATGVGTELTPDEFSILNGNTVQFVACFAEGTRIGTVDGGMSVERLAVGDRVVLAEGGDAPVVWIGTRAVDCARHPAPETVWPVRVSAGAFGAGVPVRDLWLSPDHAVFVEGVLVPVRLLVNGGTVRQEKRRFVRYFHVELPRHEVILAEGLAVESYLDTGDRGSFSDEGVVRLVPVFGRDVAGVWEMEGAAELVVGGERLVGVRRGIPGLGDRRETRATGRGVG